MATLRYLCIVGDIEAQADQAGLELLRAQSARVVLGELCGGAGPGEASEGGATGHAATHTAVSVTVRRGWWGWTTGGRRRRGEVVLVGGEGCNHARRERCGWCGGVGWGGWGMHETENRGHTHRVHID